MDPLFLLYVLPALVTGLLIGYLSAALRSAGYRQQAAQRPVLEQRIAELQQQLETSHREADQLRERMARQQDEEKQQRIRMDEIKEINFRLQAAQAQWLQDRDVWKNEREDLKRSRLELKNEITVLRKEKSDGLTQIAMLETKARLLNEKLDEGQEHLQQATAHLKLEFQAMAARMLDEKAKRFSETQEKEMSVLLQPVRDQLEAFRNQVEKTYYEDTRERSTLRSELQQMMQLNQTLSEEAKQLTQALKGNTKTQGDWGEHILETLLERCGLQKGISFFVQESGRNEQGQTIRPDIIIELPNQRQVVIDSKVSLTHYEQYCREGSGPQQKQLLTELTRSVRKHIEGLSGKGYATTGRYEMVIMFMPLEAAYITALQQDPELAGFAMQKQVLFISSTSLLLTLRLIADMWRTSQADKNARLIADKAGKLFDKLHNFMDTFEQIGKKSAELYLLYQKADGQLRTGHGNALHKANELKKLGARSTRERLVAEELEEEEEE